MRKNINRILTIMIATVLPCVALADAKGVDASAFKASWGNPTMKTCGGASDMGDATIGRFKATCKGSYDIPHSEPSECRVDEGDDLGMLLLLAREINANGAKFCVTTAYSDKRNKKSPWTEYANPKGEGDVCQWLCKPGFGGEECKENSGAPTCDLTPLRRSDFDKYEMGRDSNLEYSVAMFERATWKHCRDALNYEHDIVLAVSGWLDSGHGAWARPFVIVAEYGNVKSTHSGVAGYPVAEPTLLCKSGYTANASGDDCVPVDDSNCTPSCQIDDAECVKSQMCPKYPYVGYDATTMVMEYADKCYKYRCKEDGYAHISETDRTCRQCERDRHGGVAPDTGVCIKCDEKQVFDSNAKSSGYCVGTTAYTKTDLQYGKGNTYSDVKNENVNDQCWTKANPDEYRTCVINSGTKKKS